MMLGVVDSLMVGRLGAVPLAASSLVNGLILLIIVLGIGMSVALTPLVAIAKGSEKHDECGIILRQGLLVNIVFSFLLVVVIYFLADLIHYLNQPVEVAQYAESYLKILNISIIPFMLFQTYKQFSEGLSFTKPPMTILIFSVFINAFLNWILIFGNLGLPRLELDGAGYATLMTRIFMAAAIFIYIRNAKSFQEFDPSLRFKSVNFKVIRKIVNIGVPGGFQMFFEVGGFSFAAIMVGWIGVNELAAHQIALNLASITFMVGLGISISVTIRVGNFLGKRDSVEIKKAGYSALFIIAVIMSLFGIMFFAFRNYLPTLYINDVEVIKIASSLIIIAAIFQIVDGLQIVGVGILRGLTDMKAPMVISFIAYWVIGLPVAYLLGFIFDFGVEGIWVSFVVGLTLAAIFFILRFRKFLKYTQLNPKNSQEKH
ncbi:MAG: MATE family efflux transporter [Ignavibacteriales bacterium CG18_big_fil_WC_8_21_14_2_50_31_20]|nr:MAG: MATE family efflux transporter [Ignavibacteriales bacterium CG18_big_fil_WC_8_21_14_2_50_31_20]